MYLDNYKHYYNNLQKKLFRNLFVWKSYFCNTIGSLYLVCTTVCLWFVATHNIHECMHMDDLGEVGSISVVVIGIFGKSAKSFILLFSNGIGVRWHQALSIFPKFYSQYINLLM
jgi:hypothetical protein